MNLDAVDAHMRSQGRHPHPPSPPMMPSLHIMDSVHDMFDTSVRAVGQAARALHDMLHYVPSHRPIGSVCNYMFHTRIAHNSVFDIVSHIIFVACCSSIMGVGLGVTFGLSVAAQDITACVLAMAWHVSEPDGIFSY